MTSKILDTGTGDRYSLLGAALNRQDVWLVRHQGSQELALVQRFSNPSPALAQLLSISDSQLPCVKDSWMDNGAIYVVLERVDGTPLEEVGKNRLSGQAQAQLKRLRELLQKAGFHNVSTHTLCLSADGVVRLRCFPGTSMATPPAVTVRVSARKKPNWLGWFSPLLSLFSRPQAA